jgi:hypothetical protein
VLDLFRLPMVGEAGRKPLDDPRSLLHLAQQQPSAVARDRPTLKPDSNFPSTQGVKFKEFSVTLCTHKAVSLLWRKSFSTKCLCQKRQPFSIL